MSLIEGMAVESVVKPLRPSGTGWLFVGKPAHYDLPYPVGLWFHEFYALSVISAVEVAKDADSIDRGPEYHISVAKQAAERPGRASTAECAWALAQFGLEGSEEDNHVQGGVVRNFWRAVAEPLIGLECACKDTEPAIIEDKGEFVWRPV